MAEKDFTDEVPASKYLSARILDWGTKTTLRIWGVDHNPELAMPTQEIYAMVKSYKNKPTIANPSEPFGYRYITKKRLLAILGKRLEDEKDDKGRNRLAPDLLGSLRDGYEMDDLPWDAMYRRATACGIDGYELE